MLPTLPNVFVNGMGESNIIDAPKVNANFDELVEVLTGNIEKDNIKVGSAICIRDVAMTISAAWTFSTNPIFNAGGISDAALSSNIPKKDATNAFSAKQTFNAGVDFNKTQAENIVVHKVSSLPGGESADIGRIVYCTTDNKFYGWNGTAWNQLDYTGGYTGGAVRGVSDFGIVDDGDGYKLWFKTEGASPTVKIAIKGEPFPKRFYTELAYHTHAFTGDSHTHSVTDSGHIHSVVLGSHDHGAKSYALSTHTHGISGDTGNESANHLHHTVVAGGSDTSIQSSYHHHAIALTSETPSASDNVDSKDLGSKNSASATTGISLAGTVPAGSNAYAGVNIGASLSSVQKLYGKNLSVKIDGTTVTSNILTATGWGAIGDGTGAHAFHTTGSGEMNASAWKSYAAGYHLLEILEPDSGFGCNLLIFIETS
jgi:hypothetical protein